MEKELKWKLFMDGYTYGKVGVFPFNNAWYVPRLSVKRSWDLVIPRISLNYSEDGSNSLPSKEQALEKIKEVAVAYYQEYTNG